MKKPVSTFVSATLIIFLTAFTHFSTDIPALQVQIQGLENQNIVQEGVYPEDFDILSIQTGDQEVQIQQFEIIHARANRPIQVKSVDGNEFDLHNFEEQAKSGDRIVIEIMKWKARSFEEGKHNYIAIPIR